MSVTISGVGAAVPNDPIPNSEFAALGVDDEWIASRTGVRQRHHLRQEQTLAELALEASEKALADAGISAEEIDFVLAATTTADQVSPGLAPVVAAGLGAPQVGAVDLNAACSGFLYALDYAASKIEQGSIDRALVIGADAMSRLTNPEDAGTAVLFADGAGAAIVQAAPEVSEGEYPYMCSFGSDGSQAQALYISDSTQQVVMDGAEVYMAAVDAMSEEITYVLDSCGIDPERIDQLVCHQANGRIMAAVARRLRWDSSKVLSYIDRYGNTSAASIPITLAVGQQEGHVKPGDLLALTAFGAGFTWGAGVIGFKTTA